MPCNSVNFFTASLALRSASSLADSQSFSSRVRNFACSGRSVSTNNVTMPMATVGMASAMYMICQPLRPSMPSNPRRAVESGAPPATAMGSPIRKPETMRAW